MNDSDDAIVVWSQHDGVRYKIWASHYIIGTGWSVARVIDSNDYVNEFEGLFGGAVGAFSPKVAIDSKGNATVVWHQRGSNAENDIWSNRYDAINGWSKAEIIGAKNKGQIEDAQIVVSNDGNALAVWKNFSSSKHKIQSNRYISGIGWGEPEFIDTNIFIGVPGETTRLLASGAAPPQIALDGDGNAIAIWDQYNGKFISSIWVNRYNLNSGWGVAEPFGNGEISREPQLNMNSDGNAIVVFKQSDGSRSNTWAREYTRDLGWGESELIGIESFGSASSQEVAIDLNGNAISVWRKRDGNVNHIFANIYSVASGWGIVKRIEEKNDETYSPQVTMGANGNAIVMWSSRVDKRYHLWAVRYSEDTGWDDLMQINTN